VRFGLVAWLVAVTIAAVGNLVTRPFVASAKGLYAALIRMRFRILSIAGFLAVILRAAD
jgi:hypothetical protein